jgi:hypothetical protein
MNWRAWIQNRVGRSAVSGHAQPVGGAGSLTAAQQIDRHELLIRQQDRLLEHHPAALPLKHHSNGITPEGTPFHVMEQGPAGQLKDLLTVDQVETKAGWG